MKAIVTSSPHIRDPKNISQIMRHVIYALLPATFIGLFLFGLPAILVTFTSVGSAMGIEYIINRMKKEPTTILDGSAALTGLLLALTLPPSTPLWVVIIGNLVAIGLAKHTFGGLTHNIFNPALTGRLFLMVAYPVTLTTWHEPSSWFHFSNITAASPLSITTNVSEILGYGQFFLRSTSGSIGEMSTLAILLGAAWLFYKKIIGWRIPFSFIGSLTIFSLLFGENPLFHVFTGGALFGAFFMITDYTTSPTSKWGRIFYGILIGFMVMAIRLWNHLPEGVAFSILLANAIVPLIDQICMRIHLKLYDLKYNPKPS
jgi:Na+-translocating ferredoxin:NAD+ oxidoreductase subunit D